MLTDSISFEKHTGLLRDANNSTSKTRTDAENKVVAALEAIKSQFKTWEDLAEKNADLRERLVEEEQKSNSSKEKITKLEEDLHNKNNAEADLRKRVDELQSSQASLESEKASAEASKARLLELTTSESNLKQDLERLKSEKVESMATIASMAEQKTTLQREKGDLQVRCDKRVVSTTNIDLRPGSDQRDHQITRRRATRSSRLRPREGQNRGRCKQFEIVLEK
jgi:chromosome segregation ATPase